MAGTEGGIRLYLTELVELTETALQSQSWLMKAQAAAAMTTIATKLDANLGPPHLGLLLTALTNGLAGRTWSGKVIIPMLFPIGFRHNDNIVCQTLYIITSEKFTVPGAANVSVNFFSLNMLGDIELNVDTTNNHPVLTSYFAKPSFKKNSRVGPDFLETLTMFL